MGSATPNLRGQSQGEASSDPWNGRDLRVLCYNIHHGRGTDDQVDLARIAKVILETSPDVVALQEVDFQTKRTQSVDQASELGRLTNMHSHFFKQIDFEGGEYGQAILSKYPLSNPQIHWLPGRPDRERRILGTIGVSLPGVDFVFGTTHLHHQNEAFRIEQAAEINRIASQLSNSCVLAGDFNAIPSSKTVATMTTQWDSPTEKSSPEQSKEPSAQGLLTFPAGKPDKQIDFVFTHPKQAWEVKSAQAIPEPIASDHRPLLVVLTYNP